MSAEDPYFVDRWYLWKNGKLQHRRLDCASLDEANGRLAEFVKMPDTTRVVISKRGFKRNSSAVKVWQANPADMAAGRGV